MASKVNKKYTARISGILSIEDESKIFVEVEDRDKPIELSKFFSDFDSKDVVISISHTLEF